MKKILVLLLFSLCSIASFAQSFSVNPKSMSVPRYANQAAITAAIPSPTEGMMVYNNALDQLAYYNGTAWTNLPPTGPAGSLWTINAAGLIAANQGYNGIEVLNITAVGSHGTLARPLINADGGGTTFFRFGRPQGNWAISEEVVTTFNQSTSSVNWRYNDNASPQAATHLFGYSANAFNVTGALNATGNGTVGGNLAVTGTGTIGGKTIVGSSTATTAGMEIRSSTGTDANPDIYFKGTNNVLRYGNNTDGTSIVQTSISNNTPSAASLSWKHLTNAATPAATPMMSIDGEGDLTVNGFTKLGGTATDVPAIKTKLLTGNIAANSSGLTTTVAHGLNSGKIVDVKVLVSGLSFIVVSENFVDFRSTGSISGYQFSTFTDGTNIYITRSSTNGANIGNGGGLTSTYRILITYIP